jgi:hypothetical protein
MPTWLSIQVEDFRLGFDFGSVLGYFHEPHVFNFLSFPAYILLMSVDYKLKFIKLFITIIFLFLFLINFSGTAGLIVFIITGVFISLNFNFKYLLIFLLFSFILFLSFSYNYFDPIVDFYVKKSLSDNSSLDYSTSKIFNILNPTYIFGDGVLLISENSNSLKSGGFFTSIFYVLFYLSVFNEIRKLLMTKNYNIILYGYALLYFTLHSFKMSGKIFVMPLTFYFIAVYFILKTYIIPSIQNTVHENS